MNRIEMEFWLDMFTDDEHVFCNYKRRGVGRGHCNSGQRRKWTKHWFFEQDLLASFQQSLSKAQFASTFAGYKPDEINWFFNKIKTNAIRPKETEWHCRNKLLMWLDKLHNELGYQQLSIKYHVGSSTVKLHITDILQAILKSFTNENSIIFQPITIDI